MLRFHEKIETQKCNSVRVLQCFDEKNENERKTCKLTVCHMVVTFVLFEILQSWLMCYIYRTRAIIARGLYKTKERIDLLFCCTCVPTTLGYKKQDAAFSTPILGISALFKVQFRFKLWSEKQEKISCGLYCSAVCITRNFSDNQKNKDTLYH